MWSSFAMTGVTARSSTRYGDICATKWRKHVNDEASQRRVGNDSFVSCCLGDTFMQYAIPAPAVTTVAVTNGESFPVHRIYCVGRNYAAHAREMGHDPNREPPFFFMKPADAIVASGSTIPYPSQTADYHYEIEMVVALKGGGRDVPVEKALELVYGYAVGLDM